MTEPRKFPFATIILVLVITIIQVLRMFGGSNEAFIMDNFNVITWEILYNQPWRILTSPFIHQNLLHYLENLFFLLLFGWFIERKYGWAFFLGAFWGGLVTGYVIWINIAHDWIIGTSGGICGLFGFSLIANRRAPWWKTLTHYPLHILYTLNLIWSVVADVIDFVPFEVAHLNHVVGILFGLGFGAMFLLPQAGTRWRPLAVAVPILLFASQFYAPWQDEWQLVKLQPSLVTENPECAVKSIEKDYFVEAPIVFVNETTNPIGIYWLDYQGDAQFYLWIKAGGSKDMNSFIGNSWCIVDVKSGKAVNTAVVKEPGEIFTTP